MREIKFRAWDKRDKKFIVDYRKVLPCSYEGEKYDVEIGGGRNHLSIYVQNDYGEDCELLLYTGLKDKNGKEIYDSDIVEWRVGNTSGTGIVEWSDKEASWIIRIKEPKGRLDYWFLSGIDEIEVIGNIYEGVKKKTKRYA